MKLRIMATLFAGLALVSACIGVYLGRLHLLPFILFNLLLIWFVSRER